MSDDKQVTGSSDLTYNLVSTLYHCLESAKTLNEYLIDAEEAGDRELAAFFRDAVQDQRQRGEAAKTLLAERLSKRGCC